MLAAIIIMITELKIIYHFSYSEKLNTYTTVVIRSPVGQFISSIRIFKIYKSWQYFVSLFQAKHKHIDWIYNIKLNYALTKIFKHLKELLFWVLECLSLEAFKHL